MAEESIAMSSRLIEDYVIVEHSGASVTGCAKKQKDWKFETDIDLFLLGRTGNGKSATGNSILRRQAFKSSASMTSVTTEVNFDFTEFNGRFIKVVDVRGVQDTSQNIEEAEALFIREMKHAVAANPKGYHAFLIVLKYGTRFTQEEVNTIKFLKSVFGETFVKDHCILVMAGGDLFFHDYSSNGLTFINWCEEQQGLFKELLQECSHRIVLFNNWCEDESKNKEQVNELLDIVDQLKGTRYTDDNFKQAKLAQTEIIMQYEVEHALMETCLILEKLKFCQKSLSDEQEALNNLLARSDALMLNLYGIEKKTELLQNVIVNIDVIRSNVLLEIEVNADIKEWIKSFKDDQKKMELMASAEKKILTDQYFKSIEKCSGDDKLRLKNKLEEEFKNCEKKLEQEKQFKEKQLFDDINKSREKLKLERQILESKYEEIKSNYIMTVVYTLFNKLRNLFSKALNFFRKAKKST